MAWIIAAAVALLLALYAQRRQAPVHENLLDEPWRRRQPAPTDPDDRPANPRFPTWDAAFNRAITDQLRFRIEYADSDGVVDEREIEPISIHLVRYEPWVYIKAYCHLRQDERTFRSDRIRSARNMKTGRPITDLGQYLRGRY